MFGDDEEILQDFLVEAGEILELLSEQLVELEQRPDDKDLLNAIFRGFHTVKGGAGFLQLNAMVDCCHVTENLFDILRNGQRDVTPELMDVVLQSLDTVNSQFQEIQSRQEPTPADPAIIKLLERLVAGEDISADGEPAEASAVEPAAEIVVTPAADTSDADFENLLDNIESEPASAVEPPVTQSAPGSAGGDISEDEFEDLLDQIHGKGKGPGATAPATSDETGAIPEPEAAPATPAAAGDDVITEDEFEALLDQLHGEGQAPGAGDTPAPAANAEPAAAAPSSDNISDDEFEALLDQLHGKGKGPTAGAPAASTPPPAAQQTSSVPPVEPAPTTPTPPPAAVPPAKPAASSSPAAKPAPGKPELKAVSGGAKPAAPAVKAPTPPGKDSGAAAAEATVRVDTQRLDDIMNMVGELVLVRNRLVRLGDERSDETLSKAVSNLDVVTADLQSAVMKTRMQPIKKVFGRFPRVVRDLARNLKKEIALELVGEETDLDKNLVEALADPLVHLVRNSVDHGIELPEIREQNNKPRMGKVILSAQQEGDHILLSITDDGGGMDANKLRGIAVEKGVCDEDAAARLSDQEAFALIFAPGFSTKKEISDVSGRGVGMDVVKTKITQLNGTIEIHSQMGEGTRFDIKVPLTLAIMPTLMIMLEDQTFALPLVNVDEIFHMDLTKTNVVDGQECITIREKAIPIFHLKHWLVPSCPYSEPKEGHVVIVSVGTQRVGFVVDQLIGQEEVVIKPLGKMLHGTPGMAGATITGDGTIALILDVPSMLKRYVGNAA
ncbi:chemotaxis protein CheA [Halioxenophilus aromaticivorans]|uniref:Chemotaxis protein CheA n=1 Tax=Halioxenophilus aromaticivorans TaxID=1306992 RepID=A0AAV3U0C5_9ALTE